MGRRKGETQEDSTARKQEIIRQYKTRRATLEDIGQAVGVTKAYVSVVLKEANLMPEPGEGNVADLIAEIKELSGWTNTDIGLILGSARETVSRWGSGEPAGHDTLRRVNLLAGGLRRASDHS